MPVAGRTCGFVAWTTCSLAQDAAAIFHLHLHHQPHQSSPSRHHHHQKTFANDSTQPGSTRSKVRAGDRVHASQSREFRAHRHRWRRTSSAIVRFRASAPHKRSRLLNLIFSLRCPTTPSLPPLHSPRVLFSTDRRSDAVAMAGNIIQYALRGFQVHQHHHPPPWRDRGSDHTTITACMLTTTT